MVTGQNELHEGRLGIFLLSWLRQVLHSTRNHVRGHALDLKLWLLEMSKPCAQPASGGSVCRVSFHQFPLSLPMAGDWATKNWPWQEFQTLTATPRVGQICQEKHYWGGVPSKSGLNPESIFSGLTSGQWQRILAVV